MVLSKNIIKESPTFIYFVVSSDNVFVFVQKVKIIIFT